MTTVRAVRYDRYGPPEVLHLEDVPAPQVGPGDVLVKVHAAGVGGGEAAIRAGRLRRVLQLRLPQGVGNDFAGRIAALGRDVRGFAVGDAVWGLMPHLTFGSTAEEVAVPARLLAPAPHGVDLVAAAALPSVGTTVVTALTEQARLRPGQRLLVRGASGGVGSVAVQLGKALGAHVTALVSARDLAWITDLGADTALDRRDVDLASAGRFDVVLDAVGTDLCTFRRLLEPGGRLVALALDPDHLLRSFATIGLGSAAPSRMIVSSSNDPSGERTAQLTQYVEEGAIRPVVDTVFPMSAAVEAHWRIEAGGVRGRHVIAVRGGESDAAAEGPATGVPP